jgi:hypothetical protein
MEIDERTLADLLRQAQVAPPRDAIAAMAIQDVEEALRRIDRPEVSGQTRLWD